MIPYEKQAAVWTSAGTVVSGREVNVLLASMNCTLHLIQRKSVDEVVRTLAYAVVSGSFTFPGTPRRYSLSRKRQT